MKNNYAVILAGGQGSRFWPLSRILEPKQFLDFHGKEKTLFERTLLRINPLVPSGNIYIVSSSIYRHQIKEFAYTFGIPDENLLFEPQGKNTAASILLAAQAIYNNNKLANICVLPCDHLIKNAKRFLNILKEAFSVCQDNLVVFGIPAHRPATGYGYIKVGRKSASGKNCYEVEGFFEKPDLKRARYFVKMRVYSWNSGIFVGAASLFMSEFKKLLPLHYKIISKINPFNITVQLWNKLKSISFDKGILEKTDKLVMIKAENLGWSDLGSWQAWDELAKKDKNGNLLNQNSINIDNRNLTIVGDSRVIAAIGLRDLIVVDTPDALLITKKDRTEEVKGVIDALKTAKRHEYYTHKTVKRPWGSYTVLDQGNGFKVKLVEVRPHKSLSLQFHNSRSEHWVVLEGQAKIVKNKKAYIFKAHQSIDVPVKCIHRLSNPGKHNLKIIEVQAGRYLEEDDIVRLKDDFNR